jgi:hypothetical protein
MNRSHTAVSPAPTRADTSATPARVPDLRARRRWFAAVLMPIGPLAVAALRFLLPYNTTDSAAVAVAKVAAHPGREKVVLWLTVVAFLTLVPGAYAAVKLASRRAPVLAAIAAFLLIPAYLALSGVALLDNVAMTTASHQVNQLHQVNDASIATIADLVNKLPTTTLLSAIFVAGHLSGSLVLAFALRKARVVPLGAALVLGVSQLVHFAAAISGNHPLDLLGWSMTAIGMGFAAVALTRTPDNEWDLPPLAA